MFITIFIEKKKLEMHAEMSEIAVINDNDNFAPLFCSLCDIIGD